MRIRPSRQTRHHGAQRDTGCLVLTTPLFVRTRSLSREFTTSRKSCPPSPFIAAHKPRWSRSHRGTVGVTRTAQQRHRDAVHSAPASASSGVAAAATTLTRCSRGGGGGGGGQAAQRARQRVHAGVSQWVLTQVQAGEGAEAGGRPQRRRQRGHPCGPHVVVARLERVQRA